MQLRDNVSLCPILVETIVELNDYGFLCGGECYGSIALLNKARRDAPRFCSVGFSLRFFSRVLTRAERSEVVRAIRVSLLGISRLAALGAG